MGILMAGMPQRSAGGGGGGGCRQIVFSTRPPPNYMACGTGKRQGETRCTSRSGPRTSLGPVTLTVGVVLGPVWGPLH